jgi:hypothetical protein
MQNLTGLADEVSTMTGCYGLLGVRGREGPRGAGGVTMASMFWMTSSQDQSVAEIPAAIAGEIFRVL